MLSIIEMLINHLNFEELEYFFEDVKEEFITNIYKILNETKYSEIQKTHND